MSRPSPYSWSLLIMVGVVAIVAIIAMRPTMMVGDSEYVPLEDAFDDVEENIVGAATITTCGLSGDLDKCCTALSNAVRGQPVDYTDLPMSGSDASQMFLNGGSQNIPTMCRAAHYVSKGDPAWMNSYFDYQTKNGFMMNEVLSPVYGSSYIASEIFVVYHEAGRRGDVNLQKKASDWLRTFYALNALATQPVKMNSYVAQIAGKPTPQSMNSKCQITAATAGTRSRSDSYSDAPHTKMLSGALGRATSGCGYGSNSYLSIASRADLTQLVPASVFGITEAERATLNDLINNGGSVDQVVAMTAGMKPFQTPFTFIRTTEGSMSYFGSAADPNMNGFSVSGNKPATYAVRILRTGELRTLWPDTTIVGACRSCPSGRKGFSAVATDGPVTDTLPFPGGSIQYIVEWSPTKGAWVVQKSGTVTTVNPPPPTTSPPATGCVDSDGGANAQTYGTVTVNGVIARKDVCASTSVVTEAICLSGQASAKSITCASGTTCQGGVCKGSSTTASCKDTDGGQDEYVYGVVTDATGSYADSCSLGKVVERFCNGSVGSKVILTCADGTCKNGACADSYIDPVDKGY